MITYLDFNYTHPNIEIVGNYEGLMRLKNAVEEALQNLTTVEIKTDSLVKFTITEKEEEYFNKPESSL